MMDADYSQRFSEVRNVFLKRHNLTLEKFPKIFLLNEECLGFQFWLEDQVAELSSKHKNEWANLQKQVCNELYVRNLHYLFSALELATMGLCGPIYNILRTVYESILKMYYIWAYPEEVQKILDDMDNERHTKYGHGFLITSLYEEKTKNSMKKLFNFLSINSHSNYTSIGHTIRYSENQVKDCLGLTLLFSFFNITSIAENLSSSPSLLENKQVEKLATYLEKIRSNIVNEKNEMSCYFPNKPDLFNRLKIRPP